MITITGTLFDLLGCLAFVIIHVTILATWRSYKQEQLDIERWERQKEEKHYYWLARMGLEETGYYFNYHGLRTITLRDLWEKNVWK